MIDFIVSCFNTPAFEMTVLQGLVAIAIILGVFGGLFFWVIKTLYPNF